MSPILIIMLVFLVLVALLFIGGYVANARRRQADRGALHEQAREANEQLAIAHAEDKGWERTTLDDAARAAYAQRFGHEPKELMIVQVIDRPGTDEDKAVFNADGERLILGRRGGEWVAE